MSKIKDDNCIFCKLAHGDIPTNSIYEDQDFNVILDASPGAVGHAIILPKNHAANLFSLDKEDGAKLMNVAQICGKAIMEATGCEGLNLLQNNGEAAGQTVFHFHMHLIPRFENDTISIHWEHLSLESPELLVHKIKQFIK